MTAAVFAIIGAALRRANGWRRDLAEFPSVLTALTAESDEGSIIIGGDLNSTIDMRPFRRLSIDGYRGVDRHRHRSRQRSPGAVGHRAGAPRLI